MKILDFTTLLPGPYATMFFSDLGADVLKVASASRPDIGEHSKPFLPGTDVSASVAYLGRNKRCMTLNLKDPRSAEVIHRLITLQGYDIVIEQFRPGVMAKLNLGYEQLRKIKPDLIYCSLTGYGQSGPMTDRAGHDINYIARSGIASYSGKRGEVPPLLAMQVADVAAGSCNAVIGILASVIYRRESGQGQYIDVSMTDGMMAFNTFLGASFLTDGKVPRPEDNFVNGGSLYDYYETGDGEYLSFGGLEPQFSRNFFIAVGRPDLISGGVTPPELSKVKEEIREILKSKSRDEWMQIFDSTDACVEPVLNLEELERDKLANAREMIVRVPAADGRMVKQLANPIKFSKTKPEYRFTGGKPSAGIDTRAVMAELGYSEDEILNFTDTGLFD
ncbi:CaiB/BaiF CoA transferase family protein [Papillibacter cinnamivorans]|uniref:CaiB/BaiF CoA transferase family protein n=1 Tax=Papillibacter cinnamivorans TaxID=100176 RepID=UPI001FA92C9A|nr:CaiB/BaiF CoA-transferase family protein [Papillibacter cinnamivorans]